MLIRQRWIAGWFVTEMIDSWIVEYHGSRTSIIYMVIKCDKCPNDLPNRVIYQLVQASCGIMVNFTHSFLQFVWWGWGPYLVLWGTGEGDIYCQVNQHRPREIGLGRWVSTFHQKLVIVTVYLNLPECQRAPIVFIGGDLTWSKPALFGCPKSIPFQFPIPFFGWSRMILRCEKMWKISHNRGSPCEPTKTLGPNARICFLACPSDFCPEENWWCLGDPLFQHLSGHLCRSLLAKTPPGLHGRSWAMG